MAKAKATAKAKAKAEQKRRQEQSQKQRRNVNAVFSRRLKAGTCFRVAKLRSSPFLANFRIADYSPGIAPLDQGNLRPPRAVALKGKLSATRLFWSFQYTTPQYKLGDVAHTIRDKKKLLNRVRRVRGQIEAVERLLEDEKDCVEILQQIAACRGSINGLMSEVLEGHIRFHLVDRDHNRKSHKGNAVEEVIGIAKSYLK
jgi:FrmR/RcnR family transcriptional regulator, repressor of frmRAB operon